MLDAKGFELRHYNADCHTSAAGWGIQGSLHLWNKLYNAINFQLSRCVFHAEFLQDFLRLVGSPPAVLVILAGQFWKSPTHHWVWSSVWIQDCTICGSHIGIANAALDRSIGERQSFLQLRIQHLRCAILPIIELIEMFFHVKDFDARVGILTMGIAVVFLWQGQLPQLWSFNLIQSSDFQTLRIWHWLIWFNLIWLILA